jgi:glycosyltransferase involved in cell wall biosynthesis
MKLFAVTLSAPMKVLIISNTFDSLSRFRGPLISALIRGGAEVLCVAPEANRVSGEGAEEVRKLGAQCQNIPMAAASIAPWRDLKTLVAVAKIVRQFRPDSVLTYTIKPNTIGIFGVVAACAGTPRIVAIMNGLGFAFLGNRGFFGACFQCLVGLLYRLSFSATSSVFFHNQSDRDLFVEQHLVRAGKARVIPGSGVDTEFYRPTPVPTEPIVFLMIARLIREKGIFEYVEAARKVRSIRPEIRFAVLGPLYSSPTAVSAATLEGWISEETIEYWGQSEDVRPSLEKCSALVLPSYREGLSRVLLEGLASGRPLIVTDVPGCRELVEDGVNGRLVPLQDAEALSEACLRIAERPEVLARYGVKSRELAVSRYDTQIVVETLVEALSS